MNRTIGRTEFLRYGEALGWVAFGPIPSGQPGWTGFDVSPRERGEIVPSWMTPPLIATDHAVRRVQGWALAGGLDREDSRVEMLEDLAVEGADVGLERVIRGILHDPRLPPPFVDHTVRHTALTIVDRDLSGLCAGGVWAAHPLASELRRPVTLVDGEARRSWWRWGRRDATGTFAGLLVHELSHAWLFPPPVARLPHSGRASRRLLWTAAQQFGARHVEALINTDVRDRLRDERQANQLAEALGFPQPALSAWCRTVTREAVARSHEFATTADAASGSR
jgi:hypothetical protein